jgi:hypothetical protein
MTGGAGVSLGATRQGAPATAHHRLLPVPAIVEAAPAFATIVGEPDRAPAAYRSRAPPLG